MTVMPVFAAGITPDNSGGGNVNMGTPSGANNVPVLNINAPTNAGVSHNKFQDFNVDERGLVVNNLNMRDYNPNYKSSLTGEHIEFNYNFRTGDAARVILNEVISNSTTALRGNTEIYGHTADYILANPNGITCAGCGFINTGRLSLITGSANMSAGAVDSFNISPTGILRIDGVGATNFGLYAPTSADLVSNAIRVAGEIHAKGDLSLYSGNDKFDYKNKVVSSDNNAGISVAVDSTALGGMKANNIRIVATQKGFGVSTAGNLIADLGNVEITADGDIGFKTVVARQDIKAQSITGDIHATTGGGTYSQAANFSAGRDFINDSMLETDSVFSVLAARDFQNNGKITANKNLEISVGRDLINTDELHSNTDLTIAVGGDATNSGAMYSKNNLLLNAGNATNSLGAYIVSNRDLYLTTSGDLKNIGKIQSGGNAFYDSLNLHNYGQLFANGNLDFNIGNDLINYRAAGILAGGDINFHIARDLVNYKAEIYALGDILFEGRADINAPASGLSITSANMAAKATLYDNPYIAAEPPIIINPPVLTPMPQDSEEDAESQFRLGDGTILTLPADAFADTAVAGDRWTDAGGYVFIVGAETIGEEDNPDYTSCAAVVGADCSAFPQKRPTYSYSGTDTITIKDSANQTLSYTKLQPSEAPDDGLDTTTPTTPQGLDEIPVQDGTSQYSSSNLDGHKTSILDGYTFNDNLMGTLLNWAGRIEAGGNLELNADKIMNKGFDINTGAGNATIVYRHLRDRPCGGWNECGWKRMGDHIITATHLDSVAALMISGGNMTLHGNYILNQSGSISSKGDMILNAANSIKNLTYSEVDNLPVYYARREWQWRGFKSGYKTFNKTEIEQKRIYSKQRSTILSGGDLLIKSLSLQNDQVLDPLLGLGINLPMPNDVNNSISVNTKLPIGDNGLFRVAPDGKYLVVSNTTLTNPNDFTGSGYFFSNLGNITPYIDSTRIIGDPAYETRLVMDAILKATQQHYLTNNGQIGSDTEQMKALYDAALDASREMNLKVGVALTPSQIAALQDNIIWYVEQEINGEKILVPQLYLSQATVASLDTNKGSKINGVNTITENDYVVNVGTLSAENALMLNAKEVHNESNDDLARIHSNGGLSITADKVANLSAEISADTTQIKAGELVNQTKKQSEDRAWSGGGYSEKFHIEETAQTATISGNSGVNIDVEGKLHNTGAKIESANGNVVIAAGEAVFDTVKLYNSSETQKKSDYVVAEKTVSDAHASLVNVGSEINAGGSVSITTKDDATFAGSKINAGDSAVLNVGGNTNIVAVKDYNYDKHEESLTIGADWLYSKHDVVEDSAEKLKGAQVNTTDGLQIVSGKNVNVLASDINAGGDAVVLAGYNVSENGGVEKSGKGGSINVLSAEETAKHYELHEVTNGLEGLAKIALAGVTGGTSLLIGSEASCEGGHCSVSTKLGEKTKDENTTATSKAVGSNLNVGGNLTVGAADDINIRGSEITAGGNAAFNAGRNINVVSAENTHSEKTTHEDATLKGGLSVGNAYVDTGYAAVALYNAGDAVVKATENLKHLKDLQAQGKASAEAVRDAELNLTMATLNLANAELAAVSSVAGAASAAGTSFGTGMYASASMNFDTTRSTQTNQSTWNTASNISGDNVVFSSGNNMSQIGSNVFANDTIVYDITNDLNIAASKDTYRSESSREHYSVGGSVGNNTVQVNLGMDKSSNTASGTTHNNSTVQAENIVVKTGNDATFSGANVNASDTLAMDIGGNLKVESLQDTDYAKGSNWGVNVGIGSNSAGGGFNTGKSNHDSAWVSDQTELTGGTVDINVAGKTTITGAEIASGNYDENGKFVDNGNLNLATNELEYNDLHDFNTSNESGFGVQTNIGGSTNKQGESFHPSGSTTISVKDTGYESEQINRATIGGGAITITGGSNSDLTGLNRDVSLAQELTKDLITGALNGSFTIDNRVFTETGWNDIISDHEVAAETALQAGGYIVDQVSKFMVDVFTSPPPSTTLSITFTNTQQFVNNLAREPLSLEEAPKFTYENGYLCSSSGNCIYDPPLEPIYWELDLAVGSAIGKFVIGPVVGAVAETAVGRAISSATSGVKSWFWGVFGKGGSQVTTHAAERSAERGVSNAAINNAIKKPLDTGPIKYDSLGRPSQKIIGKEATVIKNPETGKVITTYPTGSKVLKKLGETK